MSYVAAWTFSPVTMIMSTRGSNDNIITLLVFLSIFLLLRRWYVLAGIIYGLSIHFKIYPVMYSFVFYFFIDCDKAMIAAGSPYKAIVSKNGFFTRNRLVFTFFTVFTLAALTAVFYHIYGWEFLWEANLYHLVRKDHRHNNSIYWYLIYQIFDDEKSNLLAILMFIPQASVVLLSGFLFYYDIFFAMLLQTWSFVIFNKVMTAQYYLWYMAIFPIAALNNTLTAKQYTVLMTIWSCGQGIWGFYCNNFENKGLDTIPQIQYSCYLWFLINVTFMLIWTKHQELTVTNEFNLKEEGKEGKKDAVKVKDE